MKWFCVYNGLYIYIGNITDYAFLEHLAIRVEVHKSREPGRPGD
jgi:hypothetical protein